MEAYVGQLLLVPYTFAPQGWAFCDGSLISIAENSVLFNLLGTTYGGDGQNTFGLPDLRGRTPVGMGLAVTGANYTLGQQIGTETVTVTVPQLPSHSHTPGAAGTNGSSAHPGGALLGDGTAIYHKGAASSSVALNGAAVTPLGGSQPHDNLQPYLTMNWIISLFGVYPSPT